MGILASEWEYDQAFIRHDIYARTIRVRVYLKKRDEPFACEIYEPDTSPLKYILHRLRILWHNHGINDYDLDKIMRYTEREIKKEL